MSSSGYVNPHHHWYPSTVMFRAPGLRRAGELPEQRDGGHHDHGEHDRGRDRPADLEPRVAVGLARHAIADPCGGGSGTRCRGCRPARSRRRRRRPRTRGRTGPSVASRRRRRAAGCPGRRSERTPRAAVPAAARPRVHSAFFRTISLSPRIPSRSDAGPPARPERANCYHPRLRTPRRRVGASLRIAVQADDPQVHGVVRDRTARRTRRARSRRRGGPSTRSWRARAGTPRRSPT